MNEMKSTRKQQAKEKQVVKIKSQAKSADEMQWKRNTGNPIIDTYIEDETKIGGWIMIEDYKFEVRMPLRKYTKKFEALSKNYDTNTGEIELDRDQALELTEIQTKIVEDMIPDFDDESDDYRVDQALYNNVVRFCWEYFSFFGRRSNEVLLESSGPEMA